MELPCSSVIIPVLITISKHKYFNDCHVNTLVFFDLHLNKRLSRPSRRRWFETQSRPLWRHCNEICCCWCQSSNVFQSAGFLFFLFGPNNNNTNNAFSLHPFLHSPIGYTEHGIKLSHSVTVIWIKGKPIKTCICEDNKCNSQMGDRSHITVTS